MKSVKDVNGKSLRREHYILLKEIGIEIVMYDLKTFVEADKNVFGFEVHGAFTDSVDFDELLAYLALVNLAKKSTNPAIVDAFEHLRLVIEITKENKE